MKFSHEHIFCKIGIWWKNNSNDSQIDLEYILQIYKFMYVWTLNQLLKFL